MGSSVPEMLGVVDGRVLGTLMEKEITTPDQYPLSANALMLGCNQTTNRHPVMHVEAAEIDESVLRLKALHLARVVHPTHGRGVTKYRHVAGEALGLGEAESAVLCVLLLRGPQTAGELRTRTDRLHEFESVGAVEEVLRGLRSRTEPIVTLLERLPGHKEPRWKQLVAEESASEVDEHPGIGTATVQSSSPDGKSHDAGIAERLASIEARVARLESALADLIDDPIG